MKESTRVFGLDFLRAFAIFCVVYGHGYYLIKPTTYAKIIPEEIYRLPVFDGVSIFFVLSGFLIGRILIKTLSREEFGGKFLMEFWVRRWFRTLPNYFLVLSFLAIAPAIMLVPDYSPKPDFLIHYYTFTQNISSPHPDFFPEAWSLAIEEWFYLCIPIPLYLSTKIKNLDRRHNLLFWIFIVIVASTLFRIYMAWHGGYVDINKWDSDIRKQVVTRLDSLMFGVLGAYISIHHARAWHHSARPLLVVGLLLLLFDKVIKGDVICDKVCSMFYVNFITLSVASIGTLFLLPKLSSLRVQSGKFVDVVTFVSLISYSMYLLNLSPVQWTILPVVEKTVMHYLWRFEEYRVPIRYLLYWILVVGLSYVLYRFYEKPITDLRDKIPVLGHHVLGASRD